MDTIFYLIISAAIGGFLGYFVAKILHDIDAYEKQLYKDGDK